MTDRIPCPHCGRILSAELLLPDFDLAGCPQILQCPQPSAPTIDDAWPINWSANAVEHA